MTNLFKPKRLSDIALKNIAVGIVLGITKPEHVSGRIPTPLIPALEELLEDYDSYKDPLDLISRLYNSNQNAHEQTFYWEIIESELMKPYLHKNAFVTACEYGNFLTAQWLYGLATPEQRINMLEAD